MSVSRELDQARAAIATERVRSALAALGEDPRAVERYLASELSSVRQKGIERVREAEARLRRGPTPFTVNTRLRLYEPIALKVRRAALQRAIEAHCELSPHAAMLLVDLATWTEIAIDESYRDALEELRQVGLATPRPPLPGDPDQRRRAAATEFVAEVLRQVGPLAVLDDEARRATAEGASSKRRRHA